MDKCFVKIELERKRKVWCLLLSVFRLALPKLDFWKRGWSLGYVSMRISHFSNISLFPKILSLKSFGNPWGNSYTKFATGNITYVLKYCKFWKYYDQDCVKPFFFLAIVGIMIQISEKKGSFRLSKLVLSKTYH